MQETLPYISLNNALQVMNRRDSDGEPVPFNCTCRTFSERRKSGGELKEYNKVKCLPLSRGDGKKYRRETIESLKHLPARAVNPNHYENKTRSLKKVSGEIRKININFLISINGQYVHF